jgi:hypothetical protein
MANRRKLAYIAGVIVLCWLVIGALIGIFLGLAHLLSNTTATIIVFQLIIYSALFGFLGTQLYQWKGKRDGWPSGKSSGRGWGRVHGENQREPGKAKDRGSGWK